MTAETQNLAPDRSLVDAMRDRVVTRKEQDYGNRKPGPGRPKGFPKTGGRKAGTPNLWSPEFREYLAEKARPFELLADVCAGRQIKDGDKKRKPTVSERMRAAETLTRKLLPDLSATQIAADPEINEDVVLPGEAYSKLSPNVRLAHWLVFALARGMSEADQSGHQPNARNVSRQLVDGSLVRDDDPANASAGFTSQHFPPVDTPHRIQNEVIPEDTSIEIAEELTRDDSDDAPMGPQLRFKGDDEEDLGHWEVLDEMGEVQAIAATHEDALIKAEKIGQPN